MNRFEVEPVPALGVFGDQVGREDLFRQALGVDMDGADEIEAKQGQVGQVVAGEGLSGEMGVNEPQPLQAGRGGSVGVETWDQDFPVIADDHVVDFALAAYEDGKLTVDFAGQFAQASRQFMGQDPVGRDFSPVELFDSP